MVSGIGGKEEKRKFKDLKEDPRVLLLIIKLTAGLS